MPSMFRAKLKTVASTPFSHFIRNASSAEKKRVYTAVMRKASARQAEMLARYKAALRLQGQSAE